MKYSLLFTIFLLTNTSYACEDKKVSTKPIEPPTKKICVDLQDKQGNPIKDPKTKQNKQMCREVKIHEKREGTKIPDKK